MATAKTGTFYLTESVPLAGGTGAGGRAMGTIDLSAYVNVPTGQAIAIDSVDFIWQIGGDYGTDVESMVTANGALSCQLTDLNPATLFVRADSNTLIASGSLNIDQSNNIASHTADLYPDNFGPTSLAESFMVVNDTLYLTVGNDGAATGATEMNCTARIRCRVVKLSTKDWMAIAIQSTAES